MAAGVFAHLVDGHDVRMVEVGRRLRLALEALHVQRRRQLAGQDHLQRHDAVEAHLPGLEDHAHAAAGDLLEDLVVAEVTHVVAERRHAVGRAVRAHGRRFGGGRRDRHGEPGELLAVGEERSEFVGQVRMLRKQLLTVGRLSRFDCLDEGGQHLLQALFPVGRIRWRVAHGVTHGGEGFLQLLQAAMDQSGDGAGRAVQPLGDLGQRPAVPVLQHQGVAGVRRQLLQGVGQLQRRLLALDLLARRRLFGRQKRFQPRRRSIERLFAVDVAGLGTEFTDLIRQVMGQQPAQPGRLLGLVPVGDALPRQVRFQQRLLHDARKVDLALQTRVDLGARQQGQVGAEPFQVRVGHCRSPE